MIAPRAVGDFGVLRRPGHRPIGIAERRHPSPLAAKLSRRSARRADDVGALDVPQLAAADDGRGDALEPAPAIDAAMSVERLLQKLVRLSAHRSSPLLVMVELRLIKTNMNARPMLAPPELGVTHPAMAFRRPFRRLQVDGTGLFTGFEFVSDGARPTRGVQRPQINNVSREEQIERPVNRHPQLALKAGQFHQVDGSKEPPGDEAGKLEAENLRNCTPPPQTGEHAEGLELKRLGFSAFQDRDDVLGQPLSLPERVLGRGRTKPPVTTSGIAALSPTAHSPGWPLTAMVASTSILPALVRGKSKRPRIGLGAVPAAQTNVLACNSSPVESERSRPHPRAREFPGRLRRLGCAAS